jgi:hypothetical protein
MQILASAGYRRGSVVERLFRDVRATEIYQGTSEAQRMIIAASVLSTPRKAGQAGGQDEQELNRRDFVRTSAAAGVARRDSG